MKESIAISLPFIYLATIVCVYLANTQKMVLKWLDKNETREIKMEDDIKYHFAFNYTGYYSILESSITLEYTYTQKHW